MASPIVSLPAAPAVCNAAVRSSKTPFRGPWAPRRTAAKGSAMLFLLAARARRRHRVTPRRSTTSASGRPTALLMDGDGQGAREFRAAWTAVSQHQKLVYTGVFAAEEQLKRSDWQKFFRETGAEAVPVPPHGGASFAQKQRFAETVGHTAMAQTAVRFFQEGLQVALLPSEREGRPWNGRDVNMDVDFVALVKFLRSKGAEELLMVLLEGPAFRCPESVALSKDFVRYGAEVFWVEVKWFGFRTPLMRAVLQHGSAGRVEHIPKDEERGPLADITSLVQHLLDLGFMTSSRDAIAPAIARCWAQNFPGSPLTVWPAQYPLHQLRDALAGCASWTFDSLEMAFVMPVGSKGRATKEVIAKYGTADCRSIFLGGGPFLLEDSEELCEEVLRRLGYLDDELNSHLEEAVALFCDGTANRRTLQVAGEAPTSAGSQFRMPPQITESTEVMVLFLQSVIFTVLKVHGLYAPQSFQRCRLRQLGDVWWSNCVQVEDVVGREALLRIRLGGVKWDAFALPLHLQAADVGLCQRYVVSFPAKLPSSLDLAEMRSAPAPSTGCGAVPRATWRVTVETWPPEEALPVPRWHDATESRSLVAAPAGLVALGAVRGWMPRGTKQLRYRGDSWCYAQAEGMDGSMAISMYLEEAAESAVPEADVLMVSSQDETLRRRRGAFHVGGTASLQSLRRALLSRKIYGAWRCAPNDNLLRINFSGKKLITSQEASKEEVYAAMQSYVTRAAIPSWRSYNGLVSCIQDDVNRNGWIWARGEKRGQVLRLPWVERFGDEENMESLLGSWQMLKEGGLVQVKDFLPTDLAQDMLEMLKALPQEEWHLSENQSSVDAEHRFWRYEGQSCQPSPQPSALGRNAWVQLRP
eukprot:s269_g5.t3